MLAGSRQGILTYRIKGGWVETKNRATRTAVEKESDVPKLLGIHQQSVSSRQRSKKV